MCQQERCLLSNLMNSVTTVHTREGENWLPQLATRAMAFTHTHALCTYKQHINNVQMAFAASYESDSGVLHGMESLFSAVLTECFRLGNLYTIEAYLAYIMGVWESQVIMQQKSKWEQSRQTRNAAKPVLLSGTHSYPRGLTPCTRAESPYPTIAY